MNEWDALELIKIRASLPLMEKYLRSLILPFLAPKERWHTHTQRVDMGLRRNGIQAEEPKHEIVPVLGLLVAPTATDGVDKDDLHACHHPSPVIPIFVFYDPDHLLGLYVEVVVASEIGISKSNPS